VVGALANAGFFVRRMPSVHFRGRTAAGVPRCARGIAVGAVEDTSTRRETENAQFYSIAE
jgi:hypothetical protein